MTSAAQPNLSLPVDQATLLRSWRIMRTIREFEERLHVEFATGEIPGFVHLYAGEEAIAAGVCMRLRDGDRIASTHRGHGHCIAKGCDLKAMAAEIYGKKAGLCAGKGGSMHIADLSKGMMGANGIVGGGPPLVCGAGLAAKKLGTKSVAARRRDLRPVLEKLFADPSAVTNQLIDDVLKYKRLDGVTANLRAIADKVYPQGRQGEVLRDLVTGITSPVIVLFGSQDRIIPSEHAENLPSCINTYVLPRAGHLVQMEAAPTVNRLVESFWKHVPSSDARNPPL